MAENNWSDEREMTGMFDFGEYNTKDDNTKYGTRITPAVSAGQMATPSIRAENNLSVDIGSTYPTEVSSASESPTLVSNTYTTENNNFASTGDHALLITRSPQEQHDYNQQGITPAVSAGQMATPPIVTEYNLNVDIGSTYPTEVSRASESPTVGSSTHTTENNNFASTGGHALLVARSTQEQNEYNQQGITPVLSSGQMATPSIRTENDLNFVIGSTYPIALSSASESSAVGSSTCTTANNINTSTRGHELLVVRSPQEQHDYNQQDLDKLKKENTEFKQKMMCVICRIKDFEYIIQPCGHLTCDVCSDREICICNTHVTRKHVCMLSR